MTTTPRWRGGAALGSLAAVAVLAAGCASGSSADEADTTEGASTSAEAPAVGERLAVSLDGKVLVLDAETLEPIDEFASDEFTRLNPAGDGRNVFVTTAEGFQVLDTAAPELTETVFEAPAAGHVVRHAGTTVLFADGTGETTFFDTDALIDSDGALPETTTYTAEHAHHGVSIVLKDGTLLTTVGDDTARSGAVALEPHDGHFDELTSSDECPEIHGEGTAAGEAVIFGCQDGALLYADGEFTKFDAPDEHGRMGNAYVSETSPIVVGDYNNDPDAEGYLLNDVALIDTAAGEYRTQNLGDVEYTWRGAVRGPDDAAYILGTDGAIHVLDPETGEFTAEHPVIDAWEGPADWQDEHPALTTDGETAYVADVANNRVVSVDLATGEVLTEGPELPGAPGEMALNLG
ncbi:zinc metallochaperone AztD [Microbacterium halophytorum]|uniref:zinc metallochaperone AztD n=1 Tax=Microbacterium halophytorum TaxID=2067568 RepID=UPI000CFC1A52|nr:zinc metallochaperone AztD [Microbacterium halophytorum]